MASLKVASFNCQGFRSSEDHVAELFQEVNVLALQEHWLNPAELKVLSSVSDDVVYTPKSPMEAYQVVTGRPFEGVALLWYRL